MRTLLIASTALVAVGCISPAHAVDRTWTNPAGGNWSVGANWTGGSEPIGDDRALITDPGTAGGIVVVDDFAAVDDVVISSGNTVRVDAGNTLSTGYTIGIDTGGQLIVQAGGTVNAGEIIENHAAGTLTSAGTVSTNNGYINDGTTNASFFFNGPIDNRSGGVFNVTGPLAGDNTFTNANGATLSINASGIYTVGGLLTNSGQITVAGTGGLNATAGGLTNTATGVITVNAGGTVNDDLNNAGLVNNSGTYNAVVATNTGTINNLAGAAWNGNVTSNANIIANAGTWNGNVVANTGTITNTSTWNGNVQANTGTITNTGTWTGNVTTAGTFNNTALGSVSGTFTQTAGTTTNTGTIGGLVTVSGGTFNQNGGTLSGGLTNTAAFNANGGAVNGAIVNQGAGVFATTGTVTGNGTFTNSGDAVLTVNGSFTGITTLANSSTNFNSVSVGGSGTLTVETFTNAAGSRVVSAGTVTTTVGGYTNEGNTIVSGAFNGAITNQGAGLFLVVDDLTGNSSFTNSGTAQLQVSDGNFTGLTTLANTSTNGVGIQVDRTLSVGTFTNAAGSTVVSIGTVTTTGGYTNDGTTNARGVFNGAIVNQELGVFTVTGGLTGNSTFSNIDGGSLQVTGGDYTGLTTVTNTTSGLGGGIQVAATRTLGATTIDNNAGGRIISQGTIAAALNNNNNGVIIASGAVNGAVTNNDTATFTVSGNLTGNGTFSNTGTARLLVQAGDYTGLDTVTNTSTHGAGGIQVSATRTLSATNVQNNAGGTIVNAGTLTSTNAIVNAGTLTTNTAASIVNGGLTNTGTVTAAGQVNGAIANQTGGTFNVTGTLTSNNTFTNADGATLSINGGGNYTVAGLLTNSGGITVANTGVLTATAGGLTNTASGVITINFGGTVNDDLDNAGLVNNSGTYNAVVASNTGTINNNLGAEWTGNVASNANIITNDGTWTGNVVANTGTITNTGTWTGSVATAGTFNNVAGSVSGTFTQTAGTSTNTGTIGGLVTVSGGTFNQNDGTLSGGVTNTATFNANGGAVNGVINNNAGTFTVNGSVTGNNTFTNSGTAQLLVTGGNFTGITTLANTSTNGSGGVQVSATRTLSVAGTFTNAANSFVVSSGTVTTTGGYTNDGTTIVNGQFGGPIVNQGAGTFQVDGALLGNSTFTNNGTAQLVVTGGNYTGITTLTNSSTNVIGVQVDAGVALNATTIVNNVGATIAVSGALIGAVTNAGTLQIGTGAAGGMLNGDVANSGALIFNRSTDSTYAGVISGGGTVQKLGAGTLTLAGTHTYGGATTVDAGTLMVDGSIASSSGLTVNNGGTVGGIGTLSPTTIAAGGTLSPGNSIGVINVQGNLTFNAGSTYAVEVSPTDADRTNVTGTAALNGTVAATFLPGSYLARSYIIVSANTRTGTFASLTTDNLPAGFTASLNYTATDAALVLTAILGQTLPPGGLPANQQGVANALNNYFNNGGTLPPGFVTLFGMTGTALVNALGQVSGPAPTGATQGATQIMNGFLSTTLNPFGGAPGNNPGAIGYARAVGADRSPLPKEAADAFAAIMPRQLDGASFDRRWNVWGQGFGGYNKTDGSATAGTADTSTRAYGFAAGADYRVTRDTTLGFALSGGETRWSLAQGLGGGRADVFQAGVYGSHSFGAAYVSGALAYAWYDSTTDRNVTIAGLDMLRANFDAHSFGGRIEAGYRVATQHLGVTPYIAGQVQRFRTPGYAETAVFGSGQFALTYDSRSTTTTRFELGTWLDKLVMLGRGDAIMLRGRVAWAHDDNGSGGLNAVFQTLPGSNFTVNGAAAPTNLALLSAGGEYRFANGLSLGGRFDGEFASRGQTYAGTGTARYTW